MKSDQTPQPKIGAGHAEAMFRQGLSELRNALYHESNVAQPAQYGLYGTKTPGEVAEARRDTALDQDQEPRSILNERLNAIDAGRDAQAGRDERPLEKE